MRIKLLLHIVFLFNLITYAQSPNYNFQQTSPFRLRQTLWTIKEGLPSQGLRAIFQSSDGYIWLASYEGLIRFDGFEFKLFNTENTKAFKNNICENIVEDKNKVLWISTRGGLIYYKNNKFNEYTFPDSLGYISRKIFLDSKNRLWLNSEKKGIFYLQNNKIFLFNNQKYSDKGILSFAEDKYGNIYFGSKNGIIVKFNGKDFSSYLQAQNPQNNYFSFLHFFDNKIYWINDLNELYYFDGQSIKKEKITGEELIYSAQTDKNGNRWISTGSTLYRQKYTDLHFTKITKIPKLIINETFLDFEGNIWLIIYRKGLIKISNGKFDIYNTKLGLHGKICNTICEINKGTVLAGFENGNIDKIQNGKVSLFLNNKQLNNARIKHILKDSKENLWISTYKGLLKIEKSGKQYWFTVKTGLPTNKIRLVFEDSKKNIWVASRTKGIFKINKDNSVQTFSEFKDLETNQMLSIREDKDGNLLISTTGKGCFIKKNRKLQEIPPTKKNGIISVFNTYTDSAGVIWIISNGNGIFRYINNDFTTYNHKNGLANNSPFDLIEDDKGYFWVPYNAGIMRLNKKELNEYALGIRSQYKCTVFDKNDGATPLMFTPAAKITKSSDGKIWLPSLNGIVVINPSDLHKNNILPKAIIEKFIVDDSVYNLSKKADIEAGKQHFIFKYTAICFKNPKKVRFKFKLEGFDKHWIETDNKIRSVNYTNLKYGEYKFMLKACNNDGVWIQKPVYYSFVIKPYFYETAWFKIGVSFVFLALIYLIYRLRISKIKQNEEKLKKIVKERTAKISAQKREIETQNEEILQINNVLYKQKNELEKHKNNLEELVKERTNELEKAKLKAEESDKLKTAFLNNMSHEIRTPLNGILGFTQILKLKDIGEENKEKYFDIVIESANQLLNIVDEIIYISKIQAGIEKPNLKKIKISDVCSDIDSYFNQIAKSKKISFKKNMPYTDLVLNTDIDKLKQILSILLNNAFKFTKKGFVEYGYVKKENLIEFFVKDSGIGIDEKMRDKIFYKFRQGIESLTREHGGLGLGLSISKAYVELLGGKIWFESEVNKGTCFYFTHPVENV
ncbi:MAG: ATP-binding protein [Bacteroidales bacterium]|nr:ATP-binding protein [Bacteroidales bacterium]